MHSFLQSSSVWVESDARPEHRSPDAFPNTEDISVALNAGKRALSGLYHGPFGAGGDGVLQRDAHTDAADLQERRSDADR